MKGVERFVEVVKGLSTACDLLYAPPRGVAEVVDRSPAQRGVASLKNGAVLAGVGLVDGGLAVELDGTDDYIDAGYNPFVNGKARTFVGLARADGAAAGDTLFGGAATGAVHPFLRVDATSNVTFEMDASGGPAGVTWIGAWPAGVNFWALVVDEPGDTVELFINGESKGVKAVTEAYPAVPGNLKIGARGLAGDPLDGLVLPFAVFLGALSAEDIADLNRASLYVAARSERVFLNPKEVAAPGRVEHNLHAGVIQVGQEGVDWGQQEINAFLVKRAIGAIPFDSDIPNRTVTIPLSLGLEGDLYEARITLEAEVARINEEGGTLKRELVGGSYGEAGSHLFADIVKATLKLGDGTTQASSGIDEDAELVLEVLPDFYGDRIDEKAVKGVGSAAERFNIIGNLPGRLDLTVTDESGTSQLGLGYHLRVLEALEESAAWTLEAEDLVPLDMAAIATLSEASPAGSTANNVVTHGSLGTSWTNILGLNPRPKVRGVGASAAGTGAVTPPLPTGVQKDDILVMYVETENQAVTAPAGWSLIHAPSITTGTPTRLTVLWKRAVTGETAPIVADPGDHVIARIVAVSGCIKTGNPWNVSNQGTEETSDTSVEFVSVSTTVDHCLVLNAVATGVDTSSTAHASAWTNANLQALTERMDNWTAEGAGGGFAMASGVKVKAGATGVTTATVGTAAPKAQSTLALKPETGGNFLNHVGLYDVWARVQTTNNEPPWLRLLYDVGDLVAPAENVAVKIPGTNNIYLVPLGQINLRRGPIDPHRWGGVIQGRGAGGGENVTIDTLFFFDGSKANGIITGSLTPNIGLSGVKARDEFNQAKGALNGKALPDGSGSWVTSGSAKGDFEVGSGVITRAAEGDSEYRMAKSPLSGGPYNVLAMQVTVTWTEIPALSETTLISGLFYNTASSGIVLESRLTGGKRFTSLDFLGISGAKIPFTVVPGQPYALTFLYSSLGFTIAYVNGIEVARGLWSGVGFPSGMSNCWIGDLNSTGSKITRTYDNFAVWVPDIDPVIFANRTARLTDEGIFRADSAGLAFGPVAYPGADLPRIPVSGPEKRLIEVAVRPSTGDFADIPDRAANSNIGFQLGYWPCWAGAPGE